MREFIITILVFADIGLIAGGLSVVLFGVNFWAGVGIMIGGVLLYRLLIRLEG